MKKSLIIAIVGLAIPFMGIGQDHKPYQCGTVEKREAYFATHPEAEAAWQLSRRQVQDHMIARRAENKAQTPDTINYTISVVFHVLHENGPENISDNQILDQMRLLNEDYNRYNPDTADVIDEFKSIIGNANIEFRLATLDPNGQPTTGIERYQTSNTNNADISDQSGRIWPRNKYLNVFTAKNIGGAAGYTFIPGSVGSSMDGIMILHNYVGSIGTGNNSGSTALTHEIGHWLGLEHVWGWSNTPTDASNCNMDDGVTDTPNSAGYDFCDLDGATCGSLDNVQNFMEYSYCSNMFSEGQVELMHSYLNHWTASRNTLWTDATLQATGVSDEYGAYFTNPVVVCLGDAANFHDASVIPNKNSWSWSFPGANPPTSTEQNPVVTYNTPGLFNATLFAGNATDSYFLTKAHTILVADPDGRYLPFEDDFADYTSLPNENYANINHLSNNTEWEISSAVGFDDNKSITLGNFSAGVDDFNSFITQSFDFSNMTDVTVDFKAAYAQTSSSNNFDELVIAVSNDCGLTWSNKYSKFGMQLKTVNPTTSSFSPANSGEWADQSFTLSNAADMTEGVLIRFMFTSDGGNNVYIDNINIHGTPNEVPMLHWPEHTETGITDNPTIDWKAVEGVDHYEYQLDWLNTFGTAQMKTAVINSLGTGDPTWVDTQADISDLAWGQEYFWRVRTITGVDTSAWSETWSFTVSSTLNAPDFSSVNQFNGLDIYPNPFTNNANVVLTVAESKNYDLYLTDVSGRKVRTIHSGELANGEYNFVVGQEDLGAGLYFLVLDSDQGRESKKVMIK